MVIDTSALVAMLADEPEAESFERSVEGDPLRLISAATLTHSQLLSCDISVGTPARERQQILRPTQ